MECFSDVFNNKRLLVTGGTGLVGLYIVAKLLRDIPEIERIVLPIRPRADGDAKTRWEQVVAKEGDLVRACDLSRIVVVPSKDLADLPRELAHEADTVGQLNGVIHIAADVSWELSEEVSMRANCEAVVGLYSACMEAAIGHPLSTVEGFIFCSTFTIAEVVESSERKLHIKTLERLHPSLDAASQEGLWYTNKYMRAKRRAEASLRLISANNTMRKVPLAVVRPGCTGGCSSLSGAIAPPGWVNVGNVHVPQAYYLYSSRPDAHTRPKLQFLPPHMDMKAQHLVPVDIVANLHIAGLALVLAHPQRLSFVGESAPVFNACPDQSVNPFSFWDHIALCPHFMKDDFDLIEPVRVADLPSKLARPLTLLYSADSPVIPLEWEMQVGSCAWLSEQMHAKDKSSFPLGFTSQISWREYVLQCHAYFWKHIAQRERLRDHSRL